MINWLPWAALLLVALALAVLAEKHLLPPIMNRFFPAPFFKGGVKILESALAPGVTQEFPRSRMEAEIQSAFHDGQLMAGIREVIARDSDQPAADTLVHIKVKFESETRHSAQVWFYRRAAFCEAVGNDPEVVRHLSAENPPSTVRCYFDTHQFQALFEIPLDG